MNEIKLFFTTLINLDRNINYKPELIPNLTIDLIINICETSISILSQQTTLLELELPIIVVGDIHGNLHDLLMIFDTFKLPSNTKYLFLGDYVDRGDNSLLVILYLLTLLCLYPNEIFLLRGNHEFSHINRVYGFHSEIIDAGFDESIWELFQEVFSYLPLASVISNDFFCVHGGLSPHLTDLDSLRDIPRPIINYLGVPLISDLVWSDPTTESTDFLINQRGSGVLFGTSVVSKFLNDNKLKLLVRGHQCTTNGIEQFCGSLGVTVFSCSDYTGIERNKAGAIQFLSNNEIIFYSFFSENKKVLIDSTNMTIYPDTNGIFLKKQMKTQISYQNSQYSTQKASFIKPEISKNLSFKPKKIIQTHSSESKIPLLNEVSQPLIKTLIHKLNNYSDDEKYSLPNFSNTLKLNKEIKRSPFRPTFEKKNLNQTKILKKL